jgi:6-phosphofructokinase 1
VTSTIRRIGILTGGGDCPGLNAVIRAVTKTAMYQHRMRVFGIQDGFQGLAEDGVGELSSFHVSGVLSRGGSILGCNNRYDPSRVFAGHDEHGRPRFEDRIDRCLETMERHRLEALVVVGGDGTMSAAMPLLRRGVPLIGVPKTIDNDVVGTDISFGFLSAAATATDALDRLHSTAESHHRVIVCEVMGRNAGWIALHAGVASGSDVILLPEIPFDIERVCEAVTLRQRHGRGFSIVAAAEGARPAGGSAVVAERDPTAPDPVRLGGVGRVVADAIMAATGIDARTTVLGHIQRGGPPIAADRVLATQFGHHAMELLCAGRFGSMTVRRGGVLTHQPIADAAGRQRCVPIDHPLIQAARSLRTSFGDQRPA